MANECPDIREALAQTITSLECQWNLFYTEYCNNVRYSTGFNYHENLWMREADIVKPLSSMFAIT